MLKTKLTINKLWLSEDEKLWKSILNDSWSRVKPGNFGLEKELYTIHRRVKKFKDIDNWYLFILDKYLPWKYTAANRLARIKSLFKEEYKVVKAKKRLDLIIKSMFDEILTNPNNIKRCLKEPMKIKGIGIAGASGIISIFFPMHFGVIDQFVAKNVVRIKEFEKDPIVMNLKRKINKAENKDFYLSLTEGVFLIEIMRKKSKELNKKLKTKFWTPRKVDIVLWNSRD